MRNGSESRCAIMDFSLYIRQRMFFPFETQFFWTFVTLCKQRWSNHTAVASVDVVLNK